VGWPHAIAELIAIFAFTGRQAGSTVVVANINNRAVLDALARIPFDKARNVFLSHLSPSTFRMYGRHAERFPSTREGRQSTARRRQGF
jgi:hypothetical protein